MSRKESFGQKMTRIQIGLKPFAYSKGGKNTQNESEFEGVFLNVKAIKKVWLLSLLGPIGFFYTFYLSSKKVSLEKGIKRYLYCDITRSKAEMIGIVSFLITILYAFIIYYYVQKADAIRLQKEFEQGQMQTL